MLRGCDGPLGVRLGWWREHPEWDRSERKAISARPLAEQSLKSRHANQPLQSCAVEITCPNHELVRSPIEGSRPALALILVLVVVSLLAALLSPSAILACRAG